MELADAEWREAVADPVHELGSRFGSITVLSVEELRVRQSVSGVADVSLGVTVDEGEAPGARTIHMLLRRNAQGAWRVHPWAGLRVAGGEGGT